MISPGSALAATRRPSSRPSSAKTRTRGRAGGRASLSIFDGRASPPALSTKLAIIRLPGRKAHRLRHARRAIDGIDHIVAGRHRDVDRARLARIDRGARRGADGPADAAFDDGAVFGQPARSVRGPRARASPSRSPPDGPPPPRRRGQARRAGQWQSRWSSRFFMTDSLTMGAAPAAIHSLTIG